MVIHRLNWTLRLGNFYMRYLLLFILYYFFQESIKQERQELFIKDNLLSIVSHLSIVIIINRLSLESIFQLKILIFQKCLRTQPSLVYPKKINSPIDLLVVFQPPWPNLAPTYIRFRSSNCRLTVSMLSDLGYLHILPL